MESHIKPSVITFMFISCLSSPGPGPGFLEPGLGRKDSLGAIPEEESSAPDVEGVELLQMRKLTFVELPQTHELALAGLSQMPKLARGSSLQDEIDAAQLDDDASGTESDSSAASGTKSDSSTASGAKSDSSTASGDEGDDSEQQRSVSVVDAPSARQRSVSVVIAPSARMCSKPKRQRSASVCAPSKLSSREIIKGLREVNEETAAAKEISPIKEMEAFFSGIQRRLSQAPNNLNVTAITGEANAKPAIPQSHKRSSVKRRSTRLNTAITGEEKGVSVAAVDTEIPKSHNSVRKRSTRLNTAITEEVKEVNAEPLEPQSNPTATERSASESSPSEGNKPPTARRLSLKEEVEEAEKAAAEIAALEMAEAATASEIAATSDVAPAAESIQVSKQKSIKPAKEDLVNNESATNKSSYIALYTFDRYTSILSGVVTVLELLSLRGCARKLSNVICLSKNISEEHEKLKVESPPKQSSQSGFFSRIGRCLGF